HTNLPGVISHFTDLNFSPANRNNIFKGMKYMDHQKLDLSKTALGIELGSTRIKAILIGANYTPIASGEHQWKDHYEHGIWTYHLGDVWTGIQKAYQQLSNEVKEKYNTTLSN